MFGGIFRLCGFVRDKDLDRLRENRLLVLAHEHGQTIGLTEGEVDGVFDAIRDAQGRVSGPELRARLNVRAYALDPHAWSAFG